MLFNRKFGQKWHICARTSFLHGILLLVSFIFQPKSYCQSQSSRQKGFSPTDTLAEVQVKGIKTPATNTSVTPVQTLGGRQLERLGNLSVADALRYFTGIQIKDYGGIGGLKTLNIRSLGSQHTAVFYDGIQLGNAQNGEIDLGKFSLENMEEIALYNSQRSNIFQPARAFSSSASLYLQSKVPAFTTDQRDRLHAGIKTGSFGLINPSFLWHHKISDVLASSVSSTWLQSNGRYKFRYTNSVYDTTAIRQNGDTEALRLEAGLYGSFRDSSKWTLKIYQYFTDRGLPRAIVSNNFESKDHQWDRNTFIQSSWRSAEGERFKWMVSGKFASDYLRYLQPEFDNIEGRQDNRYTQQEYYLSSSGQYRLSRTWDLALSTDLIFNRMSSNLPQYAYPRRFSKLIALATEFHPGRFKMQGSLLTSFVGEEARQEIETHDKKELSPAVSASWQPFRQDVLQVRAFYKNTFRMPTFNDLYYTQIGNTALKPEYTKQYDAGLTFQKPVSLGTVQHISFRADAYFNQVRDKIVAVPGENIATWMMMNLGKVDIRGLDANAAAVAKAGSVILNASLNYTWQQALDVTSRNDYNYRQQIPYTPEHSGSVVLAAQTEHCQISYSYIYTGERYSQKANIPDNYMEPWYTHDVSVSHTRSFRRTAIRVNAEINNLFNQYRDVIANFPMPGRSFRLGLSLTLN